jgi:hypothetical protein
MKLVVQIGPQSGYTGIMIDQDGFWGTTKKDTETKPGIDWILTQAAQAATIQDDRQPRRASWDTVRDHIFDVIDRAVQYNIDPVSLEVDYAMEIVAAQLGWLRDEAVEAMKNEEKKYQQQSPAVNKPQS